MCALRGRKVARCIRSLKQFISRNSNPEYLSYANDHKNIGKYTQACVKPKKTNSFILKSYDCFQYAMANNGNYTQYIIEEMGKKIMA